MRKRKLRRWVKLTIMLIALWLFLSLLNGLDSRGSNYTHNPFKAPYEPTIDSYKTLEHHEGVVVTLVSTQETRFKEIPVCNKGLKKTYMSYKKITDKSSKQFKYIEENMTGRGDYGIMLDRDLYIGVALGSYFGDIGSRYKFTLEYVEDSGYTVQRHLYVVKAEEKSDNHTFNGCQHRIDGSVIEFVIDENYLHESNIWSNGYYFGGDYSFINSYKGDIIKIERLEEE